MPSLNFRGRHWGQTSDGGHRGKFQPFMPWSWQKEWKQIVSLWLMTLQVCSVKKQQHLSNKDEPHFEGKVGVTSASRQQLLSITAHKIKTSDLSPTSCTLFAQTVIRQFFQNVCNYWKACAHQSNLLPNTASKPEENTGRSSNRRRRRRRKNMTKTVVSPNLQTASLNPIQAFLASRAKKTKKTKKKTS